jgi:hypothetical protein
MRSHTEGVLLDPLQTFESLCELKLSKFDASKLFLLVIEFAGETAGS